jgi:hypothetical protein
MSTLFTLMALQQRVVPSDVRYPRTWSTYILHRRHVFYAHNSSLHCSELEARAPPSKKNRNDSRSTIKFGSNARNALTNLGFKKDSTERQQVENYHRRIVLQAMTQNGAHKAEIMYVPLRRYCGTIQLIFCSETWDTLNDQLINSITSLSNS